MCAPSGEGFRREAPCVDCGLRGIESVSTHLLRATAVPATRLQRGYQQGGSGMLKIFKHHIPLWSLLELIADSVLCFTAVLLAASRLPGSSFDAPHHAFPSADVLLWAASFAAFMALLYSFVGLYRQGAIRVSLGALFGRGLVALSMGSVIAYIALQADGNRDYALLLLVYSVPVMAVGVIAVRSVGYLARRAAVGARRVLIVGTGPEAQSVAAGLAADNAARPRLG